ncbi:MAG: flagellin FliC [Deltaproteobacteria bacterium]|jgi:flagellin|nr:flagellin FliC [Deltaproteobacteria bacterium]
MGTALAIMTNSGSLTAQNNLMKTTTAMNKSIGRLSSGLRVTSAADDAAGLAVSENMRAQLKGFQQASRNANDGIAIVQTAEAAYQSISDTLVRMRELAVEAANDSISDTERGFLNEEFTALNTEIDRISNVTEFNGINLLDGTAGAGGTLTFQVGTRNSANDQITVDLNAQAASNLGVDGSEVDVISNAQAAISEIDTALESLNTDRAGLGATINSLSLSVNNLSATIENYGNAVGNIRDTDIGAESAEFSKSQVLQQAGVAMLSQANALPNLALRLLS